MLPPVQDSSTPRWLTFDSRFGIEAAVAAIGIGLVAVGAHNANWRGGLFTGVSQWFIGAALALGALVAVAVRCSRKKQLSAPLWSKIVLIMPGVVWASVALGPIVAGVISFLAAVGVAIFARPDWLAQAPLSRVIGQIALSGAILLLMLLAPHWSAIAGPRFYEAGDPALRERREQTTTALIGSLERLRARLGVPTADLDTTAECVDGRGSAGFGDRTFNNRCTVWVSLPFAVQGSLTEFAARMHAALVADGWHSQESLAEIAGTSDPTKTFIYSGPSRNGIRLQIQFRADRQPAERLNSETGLAAIAGASAIFYKN